MRTSRAKAKLQTLWEIYTYLNSITITETPKARVFADFCRPIEPIFEPLPGHLCTNQVYFMKDHVRAQKLFIVWCCVKKVLFM